MSIHVKHVTKRFGQSIVLNDVSLSVPTGKLVALLGPSGCGKTSMLRIISGLEMPDSGTVLLHNKDVSHVHVKDRQVGFVFQHYALFRHMKVFENIAFGLRVKPKHLRPSESEIKKHVNELMSYMQIESLGERYPGELSGGQQQRVALARALAVKPQFLLLDEPFSALDHKVRQELRTWLRKIHDELQMTTVLVTHDRSEADDIADEIVFLS